MAGDKTPKKKCKHGHVGYCGFCATKDLLRCKHGNHSYCGFCGPVPAKNPEEKNR